MSKFSFWFLDNASGKTTKFLYKDYTTSKNITKKQTRIEKSNDVIEKRIKALFKKYADNENVKEEIQNHISTYQINCVVALECKNKKMFEKLTKELHSKLNKY